MNETPDQVCRNCGTAFTGKPTGGLCPHCLLEMNLASRTMPEGDATPQLPPPSPEEIADRFPQFEILECLGRGGMGIVYKARQRALDRMVAIKVLAGERRDDPQFETRFSREARTLAKLSHPNIVTVHDFGESDGMFYLVMEYVDGVNLRDVLHDGRMAPTQALAIVPSICEALQFAHDHGVVHRDIKPENILMDRDGRVKIADFGIATLVGASGDHAGTPPYMAPEQEAPDGTVDHRTDIYALGVVFFEMLTGERPEQDPSRPSQRVEIDVRLDEIVLRALEKEPEQRYQTAGEFRTIVETIAAPATRLPEEPGKGIDSKGGITGGVGSRPGSPGNPISWETTAIGLGTVILVAMLAFAWRWSDPFRVPLMVICALGLGICALSAAGFWPFRSPLYPDPNFSSRNTRRCRELAGLQSLTANRSWRRLKVAFIAALIIGSALTALLFWVQRPRMVDDHSISAESPDGMFSAMGSTWHRMRVFGGDHSSYRFTVQGKAGAVFEKWEIEVPYDKLAKSYVLLSLDEVKFGEHGAIVWSDDGKRASFRVNGTEVSAFNTVDGGHSFPNGEPRLHGKTQPSHASPDSDREAMLAHARALTAGDFDLLEQTWKLPDDLDRRFARKLAGLFSRTDEMSVDLVSMQRLGKNSLFACFLMRNGPDGFGSEPSPHMAVFHHEDGRWRCASPGNLRIILDSRTMSPEQIGRRSITREMIAARFNPRKIADRITATQAQAVAFGQLAGPPYNLSQFEGVAEQLQEQARELKAIPDSGHPWKDSLRRFLDEHGKEALPAPDEFHLCFYLEARDDPEARTLPFADGVEPFPLEPFPCLTDEEVLEAAVQKTPQRNAPQISVTLTSHGAEIFEQLTRESLGRRLAIVVGGKVVSAPVIQSPITGGKAVIAGIFSTLEAATIVDNLNAYRKAAEEFLDNMDKDLEAAQNSPPPAHSPAVPEHQAVAVVRRFLTAIRTADYDLAIGLGTTGEFSRAGLIQFREAFELDQAKVLDAYAGITRAAVLTNTIPTRASARPGQFGYSLLRTGDHWLIRDSDFLPDDKAVEVWLADFRSAEANAEPVPVTE